MIQQDTSREAQSARQASMMGAKTHAEAVCLLRTKSGQKWYSFISPT
jgi:hypothetical protein